MCPHRAILQPVSTQCDPVCVPVELLQPASTQCDPVCPHRAILQPASTSVIQCVPIELFFNLPQPVCPHRALLQPVSTQRDVCTTACAPPITISPHTSCTWSILLARHCHHLSHFLPSSCCYPQQNHMMYFPLRLVRDGSAGQKMSLCSNDDFQREPKSRHQRNIIPLNI